MMERELNPRLFGDGASADATSSLDSIQLEARLRDIESTQVQVATEVRELRHQLDKMSSQVAEVVKNIQIRLQKTIARTESLDKRLAQVSQQGHEEAQGLRTQLKDQRVFDEKVQQMIQRHNQVLAGMEARMEQLKKALSDREVQLSVANSKIQDLQRRLK